MHKFTGKSFKKMLLVLSLSAPLSSYAFYNTAYVEVNSNQLANVGCYQLSDEKIPFFDMAVIFAANINGSDPNNPELYFNENVSKVLNDSKQIARLKKKGIKVLLTILGNHQNAGWSCMTDPAAAAKFANKLASITRKYKLDGIDIDDEYSTCAPNNYSMIMIAQQLKDNPLFKGKILTKALWQDSSYFSYTYDNYKLADFLDYGWEMSYGSGGPERLAPYTGYGMSKNSLALGISTHDSSSEDASWITETMKQGYGGAMVYDVTNHSQDYLSDIAKAEYAQTVKVIPNCLN